MNKKKMITQTMATLVSIGLISCFNSMAVNLDGYDLINDGRIDVFDMIEIRKEVINGSKTVAQAVELERFLLGMEQIIDVNVTPDTYENLEKYKKIFDTYTFKGTDNPSLYTLNYIFENENNTVILKSQDKMPENIDNFLYEKKTEIGTVRLYSNPVTYTYFLTYNPRS